MEVKKQNLFLALKEFRNPTTWSLLCKARWIGHIEIVDRKTRMTHYVWPTRKHQDIWPKGVDFQAYSRDLRCPDCWRLLCRAVWIWLVVEVKCTHCKTVHEFNLDEIYNRNWATIPLKAKEILITQIKNLTK